MYIRRKERVSLKKIGLIVGIVAGIVTIVCDPLGLYIAKTKEAHTEPTATEIVETFSPSQESSTNPTPPSLDHTNYTYELGIVYYEQYEYEKALEYFENALTELMKTYGPDNIDTARVYKAIAECYFGLSDSRKAIDAFNNALPLYEKIYGPSDSETSHIYWRIGSSYSDLWENEKTDYSLYMSAEKYLRKGYDNGGDGAFDLAILYQNMWQMDTRFMEYYNKAEYYFTIEYEEAKKLGIYNSLSLGFLYFERWIIDEDEIIYFEKAEKLFNEYIDNQRDNFSLPYIHLGCMYYDRWILDQTKFQYFDIAEDYFSTTINLGEEETGNFYLSLLYHRRWLMDTSQMEYYNKAEYCYLHSGDSLDQENLDRLYSQKEELLR